MTDLDFNEVLHAPARLSIMAALVEIGEKDRIAYPRLQEILELTSGNLTSHLRKLESVGYITQTKRFVKRMPVTEIKVTRRGRHEFESYVEQLRAFVQRVDLSRAQPSLPPSLSPDVGR
ncbi:MAG: transcriptional regulator [Propionibacteriaceae bacterium]|nr:transcriptional regulator [Propionibacteriaceae bacterium]